MHHNHLQLHHSQPRSAFALEQATADYHYGFYHVRHFTQRERMTYTAQINYVPEIHTGDWRSHRAAPHRQTCFVEFNAFAVPEHGQTPLDIELLYDGGEAGFDFVRNEPALIVMREFFERRRFFAQKIF